MAPRLATQSCLGWCPHFSLDSQYNATVCVLWNFEQVRVGSNRGPRRFAVDLRSDGSTAS